MSLEFLAATIGAVAIAIVGISYLLKSAVLNCDYDSERVVACVKADYPGFTEDRVIFDSASRGALALPQQPGPVGLVWQLQRKTVTRLLTPDQLYSWSVKGPQLQLRLAPFGLLAPTFLIDDPGDLIEIQRALEIG